MYFRECEHCGAALDPNEKCDCQDKKKVHMEYLSRILFTTSDGQLKFNFGGTEHVDKAVL